MEAYVETHLCELRRILRSLVQRILCDLLKDVPQGTKSELWISGRLYRYVTMDVCMTLYWLYVILLTAVSYTRL